MGRFVITSFRPKPGQQQALLAVIARHWQLLQVEQLVSTRPRYAMQAADGTVLEVFEWRSEQAVAAAHQHPGVQALWAEFDSVCSYIPLSAVPEAQQPFAEFTPLDA